MMERHEGSVLSTCLSCHHHNRMLPLWCVLGCCSGADAGRISVGRVLENRNVESSPTKKLSKYERKLKPIGRNSVGPQSRDIRTDRTVNDPLPSPSRALTAVQFAAIL